MLSKVLGFFAKRGKQLAGTDKAGNSYYRQLQNRDGTVTERRWVEFAGSSVVDPIPVEWNSWLNRRRKEPPTPEEMKELELRRQTIKAKAALLEMEEEKRRFRAKALQQGMNEDDVSPQGVTQFIQQVTESGASGNSSPCACILFASVDNQQNNLVQLIQSRLELLNC
ncbi:hypothetical protein M758_5G149900 [Ceratodon purpureus]|nr:hypothetical protein M758_5G149900 [Ceratodon purpureus]